jgi:hypothetical protein
MIPMAAGATLFALSGAAAAAAQEAEDADADAAEVEGVEEADDGVGFLVGGEVELPSRYVWRGLAFSEGPALQPSVWVGAFGFTVSSWANLHLGEATAPDPTWEVDVGLRYAHDWEWLAVEGGFQLYTYPGIEDAPPTGELSAALSLPLGPISLSTEHSVDLIEYPGAYFGELGLSLAHEPADGWSMEWSFALGWGSARFNEAYIGPATDALNVARGGVVVEWTPLELLYLRARLETTALLDAALREATGEPVLFVAALAVGSEWSP